MDIQSKTTSRVWYKLQSDIAALLLSEFPERFEPFVPPPAPPVVTKPDWAVVTLPYSGRPAIRVKRNYETMYYDGVPDKAADHFSHQHLDIPVWVVEQYANQYVGQ